MGAFSFAGNDIDTSIKSDKSDKSPTGKRKVNIHVQINGIDILECQLCFYYLFIFCSFINLIFHSVNIFVSARALLFVLQNEFFDYFSELS